MAAFKTHLDPILFDIQPERPNLDSVRAVDILTWQRFASQDTLNQDPEAVEPVVDAARRAGLYVVDVVACRHDEPVERSAWIFPSIESAAQFLADVAGLTVDRLAPANPRCPVRLDEPFNTDIFGPSFETFQPSLTITCEVLRPLASCDAQPALFDLAA